MSGDRLASAAGLLKALAAVRRASRCRAATRVASEPSLRSVLDAANSLTYQGAASSHRGWSARPRNIVRPTSRPGVSRPNGSNRPRRTKEYLNLADNRFADWRLKISRSRRARIVAGRSRRCATLAGTHPDHPGMIASRGWSCIAKMDWPTARGAAVTCRRQV